MRLVQTDANVTVDEITDTNLQGNTTYTLDAAGLSIQDPNATHHLVLEATDRAGNHNTTTSQQVLVQLAPELDLVDPNENGQELTRGQQTIPFDFHARANVTIPGFNTTPVDEVSLQVTDGSGTDVDSLTWTNATEQVNGTLDASAFDQIGEEYNFTYQARHGSTTVSTTTRVLVHEGEAYQAFQDDRNRGYGNLTPSTGQDRERWEIQAGTCASDETQTMKVVLFESTMDLYLENASAGEVGTDPGAYSRNDTGNETKKRLYWEDIGDGAAVTAMGLAHEATDVVDQYELVWTTWCTSDDNDDDDDDGRDCPTCDTDISE